MWFLIPALVFLRVLLWRMYPQVGVGHFSDVVFGACCLTMLVIYGLLRIQSRFFPPLVLLVLVTMGTTILHGFQEIDVKNLFVLNIYLLIVLAIQTITPVRKVKWLLGCLIGYALLSSLVGIWQVTIQKVAILQVPRALGLQGWPLSLAGQLLLFMPWALSRLTIRSGIIGAGFLSAFSVLPAVSLLLLYIRNRWVFFISLCLMIPALYLKNIPSSLEARTDYYQAAFGYLLQSPFLGAGTGRYVYSQWNPSVFAHNSYLQIWIEQGILGLAAIVWLVVLIVRHPLKADTRWVWLGLCAFLIDNFFSYTLLKPNTSFLFWVMFAAYANLYTKENSQS